MTQLSAPETTRLPRQGWTIPIEGADGGLAAVVSGPEPHVPEVFHGFEDFYHPRLKALRRRYAIDPAVGESRTSSAGS